jgi:hypothetical protein
MLSGTAMSAATFAFTSVTVSSRAGKPAYACRILVGNFTPPKSR